MKRRSAAFTVPHPNSATLLITFAQMTAVHVFCNEMRHLHKKNAVLLVIPQHGILCML